MSSHAASASGTLMAGSAAAAFIAGMIAFFAPCCSGVMMPTYLAAISGGNRFRIARLTAIYVAGVAVVVWPITLGAGAIGQFTNRYHPQLFVLGGLMMIGTAVVLWRGSMLPIPMLRQPELTGTAGSVFLLGAIVFAASGVFFIVLAVTGDAQNAPGFQRDLGRWLNHLGAQADGVPNYLAWPALLAFAGALTYLVVKPRKKELES